MESPEVRVGEREGKIIDEEQARSIYSDWTSELTAYISLCDQSHLISDLMLKKLTQKMAEMVRLGSSQKRTSKSIGHERSARWFPSKTRRPRPAALATLKMSCEAKICLQGCIWRGFVAAEVFSGRLVWFLSAKKERSHGWQSYDIRAHQETHRHFISWSWQKLEGWWWEADTTCTQFTAFYGWHTGLGCSETSYWRKEWGKKTR